MDDALSLAAPASTGSAPLRSPALPQEAPLAMPVQSLWAKRDGKRRRPDSAPDRIGLRRALVIGSAILMTVEGAHEMYRVLNVGIRLPTPLEIAVLLLFVVLFAWIALSFASAVAGFCVMLRGGVRLGIDPRDPLPELGSRTALLMPTYNEAPARVMAELQAIYESLTALGRLDHFDIFILSDTTDPDIWIAEEAAFLALRERTGGHDRIFYRRRPRNTERKSGNIAEWVRRFGAAYPQMLILDADSVMSGETVTRLAAGMERHPQVALIQTLPIIVNGNSLFARLQQFAGRVYGPLIAHGIAWWHGSEGNYWGHNAIIRTAAFAAEAGLPELKGRKPFGGHIMSHDFIEAALMRRGGWGIHMAPVLSGSYEESPPSLVDLAIRDRRWCQGNLQHMAVLPARGLHWVSRMHLLTGIGSYLTAPLWLTFLLAGILLSVQARFIKPEYFTNDRSLFPLWPTVDPVRAMWVFIGTMGLLLAPKFMAYIVLLTHRQERRDCGGAALALASLLIETVISALMAPITMLTQSLAVVAILRGRDSGWNAQQRDDGSLPLIQTIRLYWGYSLFGLLFGAVAYLVAPSLALWVSPVVLGLVLAVPLVTWTSSRKAGQAFRRAGLLRIPEETAPPPVLARATSLYRELAAAEIAANAALRLRADPELCAAHRQMLPPPRRPGRDPIDVPLLIATAKLDEADSLLQVLPQLNRQEMLALLGDDRLCARICGEG